MFDTMSKIYEHCGKCLHCRNVTSIGMIMKCNYNNDAFLWDIPIHKLQNCKQYKEANNA